jgi:cellulose synthase/poly-beta-1,6-N-acetylglucosamine synthase-like glycosyltransferase
MSNSKPRLTIGMPVHNGERYLSEALDSLLSQTFSDFELVISDNASTDGTERISREYVEKDSRVRYLRREENLGAALNFNGVLGLSSAPYFKWAATDDLCAPDFLLRSIEVLDRDPSVVLAYAKTSYIDENGKLLDRIAHELRSHSPNPHQRFRDLVCVSHDCVAIFGVFRREALDRTSLLGNYVSSDRVLLAQLSLLGKLHLVGEPLFFRRIHPSASMVRHPSPHARSGWFDSTRDGRPVFPAWRVFFEYLAAVYRSPLNWNQKMLCYPQMARWLRWNWRRLVKDVSVFGRHLLYPDLGLYRHVGG